MKTYLRALLLALPFLAVTAQAQAAGLCSLFWCCKGDPCCKPPCAGPWYTYWPYEAHFQVPAHPEFPYWPAPMTSSIAPPRYEPSAPPYMPGLQPAYHQPVGYYYQPPSYWYGR